MRQIGLNKLMHFQVICSLTHTPLEEDVALHLKKKKYEFPPPRMLQSAMWFPLKTLLSMHVYSLFPNDLS